MGKRHLTPAEIKDQCKRIARESRMADPDTLDSNGNHLQLCDHAPRGIQGAADLPTGEQG